MKERRRSRHGQHRQWASVERTGVHRGAGSLAKWLFGSSTAGWIWLVARLWLGWEWLQAGWSKLFGGNITWEASGTGATLSTA